MQTWREDEFEDRGSDDRPLTGSTSSISEAEASLPFWRRRSADRAFVRPAGMLVALEAKVGPTGIFENDFRLRSLGSIYPSQGQGWIIDRPSVAELLNQSAIVWSEFSIDEWLRNSDLIESVSASYADLEEHLVASKLEAVHPLTSAVYNQLSDMPTSTKEAVQDILNKFAHSVPYPVRTKLPNLRLSLLEDSAYLLEWTFEDRRLGFSFEQNQKDSGWYFVLSNALSERYESGTMDQLEMSRLVKMMLKT